MFGLIRPCRSALGEDLSASWLAHLCGMCLALRDRHGHLARLVTNYDAVVVSALVEAQAGATGRRRNAGACALRGMRRASVATGDGATLAAAASLLLASGKIDDHLADGDLDGVLRRHAARSVARRWAAGGSSSAGAVGLDAVAVLETLATQIEVEQPGHTLVEITAPTEQATAQVFGRTADLAGRPGNAEPLAEAGRLFGRIAHLLDAVEDLHDDHARGRWNPILATGAGRAEVRALCDDAALGIRLALAEVTFTDSRLVHALLVHELPKAVERAFGASASAAPPPPGAYPPADPNAYPPGAYPPADPSAYPPGTYPPGTQPPGAPFPPGWSSPPPGTGNGASNPFLGCLGWLVVCGTCQACFRSNYPDPCTGQPRKGMCRGCDCDCCEACECCECAECCDCGC